MAEDNPEDVSGLLNSLNGGGNSDFDFDIDSTPPDSESVLIASLAGILLITIIAILGSIYYCRRNNHINTNNRVRQTEEQQLKRDKEEEKIRQRKQEIDRTMSVRALTHKDLVVFLKMQGGSGSSSSNNEEKEKAERHTKDSTSDLHLARIEAGGAVATTQDQDSIMDDKIRHALKLKQCADNENDNENDNDNDNDKDNEYDNEAATLDGCSICMASYTNGQEVCVSNNASCQHIFCAACMRQWLLNHEECPVCRQPYLLETKPNSV